MYDILIIGNGIAALSAAYTLAKTNLKVAIVGSKDESHGKKIYPETIPSTIREDLNKLDLQEMTKSEIGREIDSSISVWGSDEVIRKSKFLLPDGIGWVFNRVVFASKLREKCLQKSVQFIETPVEGVNKVNGVFAIKGNSIQEYIRGGLLINATGRNILKVPFFARKICIDKLIAVIFTIHEDTSDEANELIIEAREQGWFYSMVAEKGIRTIAYLTDGDLIQKNTKEYWVSFFVSQLEKLRLIRKSFNVKRLQQCVCFSVLSANTSFRENLYEQGLLFIGDSGRTFDPLSSKGISYAISDGVSLATALVAHFNGKKISLLNYERSRRQNFVEYLNDRHAYYSAERRWEGNDFWRRRHSLQELKVIQSLYT